MQYKLKTPVTREDLAPLKAGDTVLLSGTVYTARDAAHKRMMERLDAGEPLPFPVEGSAVARRVTWQLTFTATGRPATWVGAVSMDSPRQVVCPPNPWGPMPRALTRSRASFSISA